MQQTCFPSLASKLRIALCSSFVKSTLLNTTTEVLHEEYTFVRENVTNSVCGLCTTLYPVESALKVEIYCCRVGVGIVSTNLFSELTIARCANVSDYDAVESIALTANGVANEYELPLIEMDLWGHVPDE